ncbi:hypothetical protein ACJJTC_001311 [Scirpophaga incertulas]
MVIKFIRRKRNMILASIFFFYIGCGITLSFLRIECTNLSSSEDSKLSGPEHDENVEYAVMVLTGPDNEVRRDVIRMTWAKFVSNIFVENGERLYKWNHTWIKKNNGNQNFIKIYFVVGSQGLNSETSQQLEKEASRNNDMLIFDFLDSYKNLAHKVLIAIKWANENLKQLKYLIKCDDDSFVRIDLIVKDLEAFAPEMNAKQLSRYVTYKNNLLTYNGLYWGYFDGRAKTFSKGKWQEKDWFLCDTYLPYALGGGYVISQSIVKFVADNADFLSLYNSEDVSMGVWTAALRRINRVHDIRFDTEWKSRGCNSHMLVRHKQTPSDMFQMYKALVLSSGDILCKTETEEKQSYSYNWNVLPSKCCH